MTKPFPRAKNQQHLPTMWFDSTVAILAQGTILAVAVTQAFSSKFVLSCPSCPAQGPMPTYHLGRFSLSCVSVLASVFLSVCPSVCPPVSAFVCPFLCPSVCTFVCPSLCLCVCVCLCLSVCLFGCLQKCPHQESNLGCRGHDATS